jgi:DNA end-binding protein Ku
MKFCPTHGEVPSNEIVSGYQVSKDRYVIVDPAEVDKLRPANERAINIEAFLDKETIEPRFYNDKTYYLVPDGPAGKRSYALLLRVMAEENKVAFAQGVFQNREQIMALRPRGRLLEANFLSYADELKNPAEFEGEVPEVDVPKQELQIARTLVAQLSPEEFDITSFKDRYEDRLKQLIDTKVAGEQVMAAPEEEPAPVINLMEALQKSLQQAQDAAKPPKKVAAGTAGKKTAAARKRKTS